MNFSRYYREAFDPNIITFNYTIKNGRYVAGERTVWYNKSKFVKIGEIRILEEKKL